MNFVSVFRPVLQIAAALQTPYIWKRRADGLYIINLAKTWEKLMLAARIVVAIENPADGTILAHNV